MPCPLLQLPSTFYEQLSCYKKAFEKKYPGKDANRPVDVTFGEGYVYDSIWAIALALNRTLEDGVTLENFTYDNVKMADAMQNRLHNVDFQGISVSVYVCVRTYVCMLCVCVHVCVCVHMWVCCGYVCMHVCVCVCVHV